MAKEVFTAPWYPWYVDDVLLSENVDDMTLAEEGAYRRALDRSWKKGPLPSDPETLAKKVIKKRCTIEIAKKVLLMFHPLASDPSLCVNKTLEKVRKEQEKKYRQRSQAGKAAMRKRWNGKTSGDSSVITPLDSRYNIQKEREREKEKEIKKEEGEGETPPLARPPADMKFQDSAFEHPAVVVYQERFMVKARRNFAKAIAERVKDLGVWNALISDKIAYADTDLTKRENVATWILKAYDERVEEKRSGNGVRGKGFPQGVVQAQPYNEMEFQKRLGEQKPK